MVIVINKNIPSERTIIANDASVNAMMIPILLYLKKITSDDMPNKIKSGSVIPNVELVIILGSKMNKAEPITAKRSGTKCLQR